MKIWNEEQITNLARRAYEKRAKHYQNNPDNLMSFREGVCAVLWATLNISWAEAERRLLKGHENLKEPKS